MHESFYAAWKRSGFEPSGDVWHLSVPLTLGDQQIGKISVTGMSGGRQALIEMQQVLDFLEPLESEIERFLELDEPAEKLRRGHEVEAPALLRATMRSLHRGLRSTG